MLYSIVGILVVIVDQLVKFWVSNHLFGTDIVKFIPGVISLVSVRNYGAAFGFLDVSGARIWFIVATGVFVILVILALATNFISGSLSRWSLVLVAAGGVGNMIDRIIYGYVQDMFKVELFNFAVFNVADIFITVFAIVFALAMIFEKPEDDELEEFADDDEEDEPKPARKPKLKTKKSRAEADDAEDEEDSPKKASAVKSARKSRQDKYEQEYEAYKAQQRAAMKKAAPVQEAPKPDPAEAPVREDDPFAAWEKANARAEAARDDSYASRVMDAPQTKPAPQPVEKPAQQPVQPAPQPVARPAAQPKPTVSEDFDLDDILAEFK
ncbi:MAG: signal peptidase II [Oscillospiraceae bacterium]|nr:signal peptidase II [Oscillospiraceae bacterium]